MDITKILESVDKEILTEDTLNKIKECFEIAVEEKVNTKIQLAVESALLEQDEDYAVKLQQVIDTIDLDHSNKLNEVLEAVDTKHLAQLQQIKEKYENELTNAASAHLEKLTEDLDSYLNSYVEELIPLSLVQEAAKNTYASRLLNEAKSVLSVDEKFASKQFKSAVKDGANQINQLEEELKRTKAQLNSTKAKTFLESKLQHMPRAKANFIKQRLNGKPLDFIKENFKFVETLYEDRESSGNLLTNKNKPNVDRQVVNTPSVGDLVTESSTNEGLINEESNPLIDFYLEGMLDR